MRFKDILTVIASKTTDDHVIKFAEMLARQNAGNVSNLIVNWLPTVPSAIEGWVIDPFWGELVKRAETELAEAAQRLRTQLEHAREEDVVETQLLEMGAARAAIGLRARHADVTVVGRPTKENSVSADAILEGPVFDSGRPVIVVPPGWTPRGIGRTIVVAWKPVREAARALGDAEDLLTCAKRVSVVTVDAKPSPEGYGAQPGADITAHLARRGAKAELTNIDSLGRDQAKAILDHARDIDADLIVMGGYGRARLSEFIFGGVTREMLKTSTVPVLMSH